MRKLLERYDRRTLFVAFILGVAILKGVLGAFLVVGSPAGTGSGAEMARAFSGGVGIVLVYGVLIAVVLGAGERLAPFAGWTSRVLFALLCGVTGLVGHALPERAIVFAEPESLSPSGLLVRTGLWAAGGFIWAVATGLVRDAGGVRVP